MQKRSCVRWTAALAVTALCVGATASVWASVPSAQPACYLGVFCDKNADAGVVVRHVGPNSPAAACGIQPGDVIVKIADKSVKSFDDLAGHIRACKPGDKCDIWVKRDGKEHKLTSTLAEKPARELPPMVKELLEDRSPAKPGPYIGIHCQELSPELKNKLGIAVDKGCLVTDVMKDSPADRAGIKAEDVITGVNDKPVAGPQELRQAIQAVGAGKDVKVKVVRGKETRELTCKVEEAPRGLAHMWRFDSPRHFFNDRFFSEMPRFFDNGDRVQQLEKKVEELENHVKELQKKLAQPVK